MRAKPRDRIFAISDITRKARLRKRPFRMAQTCEIEPQTGNTFSG